MQAVIEYHENANVRNIGQGEHRHRIFKFGGGQTCDRSID
jgi:hypothetical protein